MIRRRRKEIARIGPHDGIPRHLHHAWVGSRSIPDVEVECMATWHGQAQTYLWDDTDTLQLTGSNNLPRMAPTQSHMSDILRYFILLKCGGVWLDTDVECLRPGLLDLICNNPDVGFVFSDELPNTPGTAFIGSIPGHPLVMRLVQAVAESDSTKWNDSHVTIGPKLFADVVNPAVSRLKGEDHPYGTLYRELGVLRMHKRFIYPTNPWQGESFIAEDHTDAFTYHKCSSSHQRPAAPFAEETVENFPVHVVTHAGSPSFQSNHWRHSGAKVFVSSTTPGEKQRGCALGHLAALRAIDTFPTLVLEDDATPTVISSAITIPEDADLVFLGTSTWAAPEDGGAAYRGQPNVKWRGRGWVNPVNMLSDTAWLVCTEKGRAARISACERALACPVASTDSHLDVSFVRRPADDLVVFANRMPRYVQASEPSSTSTKIGAWSLGDACYTPAPRIKEPSPRTAQPPRAAPPIKEWSPGMQGILIDLGYHFGEGMDYLRARYAVDDSWIVASFEPNSKCRDLLMSSAKDGVIPIPMAAHTRPGERHFQRVAADTGGPEDGQGSHLTDLGFELEANGGLVESVWAVNFPVWLRAVIPESRDKTFVVVKMDIEGAEYDILRAMLADGSIDLVDTLHVEFHGWRMPAESSETTDALKEELKLRTHLIEHW